MSHESRRRDDRREIKVSGKPLGRFTEQPNGCFFFEPKIPVGEALFRFGQIEENMDQHQTDTMFKNMLLAEQAQLSTLKTQYISGLHSEIASQRSAPEHDGKANAMVQGVVQGMAKAFVDLQGELSVAQNALKEAQDITKEWQAAMEAWRDLAQTLRDEIKACPNHEAHAFGQNDTARNQRLDRKEDEARVAKGLKPQYSNERKGV